jgi:5'-nucleotidase / UDP-sugar diphosphatase
VVTNNFLLAGGDGYAVLAQGTDKYDTGFIDVDVTADYIRAHSPVNPQVEGRITTGAGTPSTQPAQPGAPGVPAQLPNTGGDLYPLWLLAAIGASAVGSGMRLRNRARRALSSTPEAETEALAEVEEQAEVVA